MRTILSGLPTLDCPAHQRTTSNAGSIPSPADPAQSLVEALVKPGTLDGWALRQVNEHADRSAQDEADLRGSRRIVGGAFIVASAIVALVIRSLYGFFVAHPSPVIGGILLLVVTLVFVGVLFVAFFLALVGGFEYHDFRGRRFDVRRPTRRVAEPIMLTRERADGGALRLTARAGSQVLRSEAVDAFATTEDIAALVATSMLVIETANERIDEAIQRAFDARDEQTQVANVIDHVLSTG